MKAAILIATLAAACANPKPAPVQQTTQIRMPTPWCVYAVLEVDGVAHPAMFCTDLRDFCEEQRGKTIKALAGPLGMFVSVKPRLLTLCRYELAPAPVARP